MKSTILKNAETGEPIELGDEEYEGTHFPEGSVFEGMRIPTAEDAACSAENLIKMFTKE